MTEISQFNFPTTIRYGNGAIQELNQFLSEQQINRPLIVTDREVAKLKIFKELEKAVGERFGAVYNEVTGNPLISQVEAGKQSYIKQKADAIIAFGGGAAIDVAKCIAVLVSHPGELLEYEDRADCKPIEANKIPPIIAIPTTAGTGSEVGRSAVVSEDRSKIKKIIFSPGLLPIRVYLDPQMTLTLPEEITATTGIDALTHLIEAYLARGFHPMCDGIALEGIRLVAESLKKCVDFANNQVGASTEHLDMRAKMLLASAMGSVAFQKGLGVNHSCAHALSAVADLHHGQANGNMLITCMRFNREHVGDKFTRMAEAIGLTNPGSETFMQWLEELLKDIGIEPNLKSTTITTQQIEQLVTIAVQDVCHSSNPRPVTADDFKNLFRDALL